jgi:hypothetical protein
MTKKAGPANLTIRFQPAMAANSEPSATRAFIFLRCLLPMRSVIVMMARIGHIEGAESPQARPGDHPTPQARQALSGHPMKAV